MRVPNTIFGQHVWFRHEPEPRHAFDGRTAEVRPRRRRAQDGAR